MNNKYLWKYLKQGKLSKIKETLNNKKHLCSKE